MVLPVFVLLLLGILFIQDIALEKQTNAAQARSCAWLYSAANCKEVPPGCEGLVGPGDSSAPLPATVENALKTGSEQALRQGDSEGVLDTVLGSLLGPLLNEAFSSSTEGRVESTRPRPAFLGEGKVTSISRHHLACNLAPVQPLDLAMDTWSLFEP